MGDQGYYDSHYNMESSAGLMPQMGNYRNESNTDNYDSHTGESSKPDLPSGSGGAGFYSSIYGGTSSHHGGGSDMAGSGVEPINIAPGGEQDYPSHMGAKGHWPESEAKDLSLQSMQASMLAGAMASQGGLCAGLSGVMSAVDAAAHNMLAKPVAVKRGVTEKRGEYGAGLAPDNHYPLPGQADHLLRDKVGSSSSTIARALSITSTPRRPRSEKKPIPSELKDQKYFERRSRNNMAAKKSRDMRKSREDEIAIRASYLEKENAILRAQVATLREEANSLRHLMLQKRTTRS